MTSIKSNHKSPLALPRGPVILPGKTVEVENWADFKNHRHVKHLVKVGVLVVGGAEEPAKEPDSDPVPPKGYAVKDKGRGWFAVTFDGAEVTKSLRAADVEGFTEMSDEDKAAFVDLHKE